ncbi:hypothetical protein D9M72_554490 [compost metagenome]
MCLLGKGRHRLGVERCRIDVHAGARLNDIGDDQADDQRQRREGQEVDHGLAGDAADLGEIGHAGNDGGDREEDDWRNDHLDQANEGIAERLKLGSERRIEMAEQDARGNRRQHLDIEMTIERCLAARFRGLVDNHDILH